MSSAEVDKLLGDYWVWVKGKTTLRELSDAWVEINTPYLDRHNDALQIYARGENGGFILTDDGYTIRDLETSGCTLDSEKRQEFLRQTLSGFGVKRNPGTQALEVHASREGFPSGKHNLIQAMLAVNDLFYLAQPFVESLFLEDVTSWLEANDIRSTPRPTFPGTSGFNHLFDFVIRSPANTRNVSCKQSTVQSAIARKRLSMHGVTRARRAQPAPKRTPF